MMLDSTTAARMLGLAVANVTREYPNKLDHVMGGDADLQAPRSLHPAFYGSFDWHSSVHQHWLMVRLLDRFPDVTRAGAAIAVLDRHLSAAAVAAEVRYLEQPGARSFERPYGWGWLLALASALRAARLERAPAWGVALEPLAAAIADRFRAHLPKLDFPIRHGVHANSALALLLAYDHAAAAEPSLAQLFAACARRWFGGDTGLAAAARFEPSGADFLSPTLVEAALMQRVLGAAGFSSWLAAALPALADGEPASLLYPVPVSDRADPQLVHLDGLNLSRAWCWRLIGEALAAAQPDDPRVVVAREAARRHLQAGWTALDSGHYVGSHWLSSFAALALGA